MAKPEIPRTLDVSELHEDPVNIDREKTHRVTDIINSLSAELPDGGWLSTLVWNTRNNYLAFPESNFPAKHMQMIVEGFLTELATLRPQGADTQQTNQVGSNQI